MPDEPRAAPGWERLESLYGAAQALPPEERAAFLDSECADDASLRRELDELLAATPAAERFFGRLAGAVMAASLDRAPVAEDALIGSTFGRYQVEARLGAGGMGVVYRAYDARLQRVVALKLLAPYLVEDPEAHRRFLTEARAAASLDHPNICTVYETGEAESGIPYIAMAYCEGETLKGRIARGPVVATEAAKLAVQMARGLAAAHARGVIHRDVKPANVMIGSGGLVKLVDFGLARLTDVTLTAPGLARGTFAYMAPELLRGQPADARTDLWSLGVVMYEMLTGTRPFKAESDAALLYAIAHQTPERIDRVLPGVPAELSEVVHRLLEDEPDARYPGAAEVVQELEALAGTWTPSPAAPSRPPWPGRRSGPGVRASKRWLVPIVAVAAVATVSFLATRGDAPATTQPAAATTLPAPRVAVLFFQEEPAGGEAAAVASVVTDSLIQALAAVPGLDVPSPSSVRPYRDSELQPSEIAQRLGAAWLVSGVVTARENTLALTAELSDSTGRLIAFRSVEHADARLLVDEAVLAVAVMVREAIGAQRRARQLRAGTRSDMAIRLVEQALIDVEDAGTLSAGTQPESAFDAMDRADSTLARASAADPKWPEPLILRARVARQRALTALWMRPGEAALHVESGLRHATAALALQPADARALEARGMLRDAYTIVVPALDTATLRGWVEGAEDDLRRATELDPSLPEALNVLSSILESRGEYEQARLVTQRAYRADYYFQSREILYRLFDTAFETRNDAEAERWCSLIDRRFLDDWVAARCVLLLMTWSPERRPDLEYARSVVARTVRATPEVTRSAISAQLDVLTAGVAARALPRDSAVYMLEQTRARVASDPALWTDANNRQVLLRLESMVWMRLGDRDHASELLARYLEESPGARQGLSRTRIFNGVLGEARPQADSPSG